MPNDPGFARDTCIYAEAVSGDGGVHPATNWWMSPDISLTGPVSGPDHADPGQVNNCVVSFHRKSAESECIFPNSESLTVELWVGNPSLVMTPDNPASAVRIGFIGSILPSQGQSGSQPFDWTPPSGLPPTDPQGPGHKCLIARVYPDDLTPSATQFYLPEDQHVVQRNICVVPCPPNSGQRRFAVTTVNPDAKNDQKVKITVTQDLEPDEHVQETVLRALKPHGIDRLSFRPANEFGIDLSEFKEAALTAKSAAGAGYEAQINMAAGQFARFNFFADLAGGAPRHVYIFHLVQSDLDGQSQGGLTIVMFLSTEKA